MPRILWMLPALMIGIQLGATADTIAPGTRIMVSVDHEIDLHSWDAGHTYPARIARDVWASDGELVIPAGSAAQLAARQTGPHQMTLDLESITVNGGHCVVDTTGPKFQVPVRVNKNVTGLVANVVSALSGANVEVETQGSAIRVPPDSTLTFQLQQPLHGIGPNF